MKKIFRALILGVSCLSLAACSSNAKDSGTLDDNSTLNTKVEITDSLDRVVEIDTSKVDKVVCIGGGSLRLYTYVVGAKNLAGIEDIERSNSKTFSGIPVPYKDINQEYFDSKDLPSCGAGGPSGQTPEAEKILNCRPNIVITMLTNTTDANKLSDSLGLPVICLSYGSQQVFNDKLTQSFSILGKVFNQEKRANEIINKIDTIKTELNDLTKNINDEDKKSVYLGCLGNFGVQDIYSSAAKYSLFEVSNIKNVVDSDHDASKYVSIDKEALVKYNPDKIILDAAGVAKFASTYKDNKETFDAMRAFQNNEVYLQMPYNAYYTNIEIALMDAYYCAMVSHNLKMNIETISNEITTVFLGSNMYDTIKNKTKGYGGFQKVTSDFLNSLA